jgi:predicted nucleic acid-binding protein
LTTNVLVVDASVIAPFVADGGVDGDTLRSRLSGETICGPDLLRVEVLSVVRRQADTGSLTTAQANAAIDDLLELPLIVYPTALLLRRAWALRHNISAYDACYVALAEALDCTLLTADVRLAHAAGTRCPIELA